MKKTTNKTKKTKVFVPKFATCYANITELNTDLQITCEMAKAKLDACRNVDVSEVAAIVAITCELQAKMADITIDILRSTNRSLVNKIKWLKRPWYKKLMFWKKDPNKLLVR